MQELSKTLTPPRENGHHFKGANEERDRIRQEIRRSWPAIIQTMTAPAKRKVNGDTSYVCPLCNHGAHGDGLTRNPKSKNPNGLKCFGCGFSGDIIDLYMQAENVDYNRALHDLAEKIGQKLPSGDNLKTTAKNDRVESRRSAETDTRQGVTPIEDKTPENAPQSATEAPPDFLEYYNYCNCGKLTQEGQPEAISYLQARGISAKTAAAYDIGFDPAADPACAPGAIGNEYKPHPEPRLIIPCSESFYIARAIDPAAAYRAPNPKGTNTTLFNDAALYSDSQFVFICEGVFDALSIIECGRQAIALNGKGNGKLLLDALQDRQTETQFVIVPDSDALQEMQELKHALQEAGHRAEVVPLPATDHDANDLLKRSRAELEKYLNGATLPGLLTYEAAVKQFTEANTKHLQMRNFPKFSELAKIQVHDSVVLAADTGGGKSSLALNFINDLNDEYPVMYFNLEMDDITVLRRLVSIRASIELDRIEGYQNDEHTAELVNSTLKAMTARKPLQIVSDVYDLQAIEKEIIRAATGRKEPTIVIIDHSLLVRTASNNSRYERFTEISENLRRIAKLNNIVLFVLLQQSREGKKDENERPKNWSLKESGSWENDATHIVFLWWDPEACRKKLIMTKHRAGEAGEITLDYYRHTQIYKEAPGAADPTDAPRKRQTKGRQSKRDKEREKLREAYEKALTITGGNPTLYDIAEAAGETTATIKRRIKEYGGYSIDGEEVGAAGTDTTISKAEFVRLTLDEEEQLNAAD